MAVGEGIRISDGECQYVCRLTSIRDKECEAEVCELIGRVGEPPYSVTVYQGLPKGDKLEVVIQKAVELGCDRIIPFESSRCIKRPKAEKAEKQTARLQRIAEEAAKQCGRAKIPAVSSPVSYRQMLLEAKKSSLSLFCYENEDGLSIKDALVKADNPKSISVIVGAEGGFSPEEAAEATEAGCLSVSLGNRILRCETAPLFALTAICYQLEL